MNPGSLYCIIITYNGMQWIERCINSLQSSSCAMDILVIDNGSTDQTIFFIKKNYPNVRVIETGKNLGFGQANNIGLRISLENNADHVFLLNQDAWVEHDTIANLVQAQTKTPRFGILSPIHLNGSGNDLDDHFYYYLVQSEIKELVFSALLKKDNVAAIIKTPFVNAAAWLISKDCLQKTGGFDPVFFHYGEDNNYGHRVHWKGFEMGILTTARIYHDKERPIPQDPVDPKKILKQDWLNLLDQACNIQEPHFITLLVKRFGRHFFFGLFSLVTFRKTSFYYNYHMAKNIISFIPSIRKSRRIARNGIMPYLDIN